MSPKFTRVPHEGPRGAGTGAELGMLRGRGILSTENKKVYGFFGFLVSGFQFLRFFIYPSRSFRDSKADLMFFWKILIPCYLISNSRFLKMSHSCFLEDMYPIFKLFKKHSTNLQGVSARIFEHFQNSRFRFLGFPRIIFS